ncbi:hypothetical protein ACKWTF_014833 [Chironomus riparius]
MRLLIVLLLSIEVTKSAADNVTQMTSQSFSKDNLKSICDQEVKFKFGDDKKSRNSPYIKAAAVVVHTSCLKRLNQFCGQAAKFYEASDEKFNFNQIYCSKMRLNHIEYILELGKNLIKINKTFILRNKIRPTALKIDSIQVGMKYNESRESYKDENLSFLIHIQDVTIKCKVPNEPYVHLIFIELRSAVITQTAFNKTLVSGLFKDFIMNLGRDFKCSHSINVRDRKLKAAKTSPVDAKQTAEKSKFFHTKLFIFGFGLLICLHHIFQSRRG